jgi:hypothetical protein
MLKLIKKKKMKKLYVNWILTMGILSIVFITIIIIILSSISINRNKKYDLKENYTTQIKVDTVEMVTMKHLTASNLYGLHCKMCHGNYGKGDGVKSRFDTTICPYDLSKVNKLDKEIYYVVLNGERKMPNQYELDTNDVWIIVFHIKKFKQIK